MKTPRFCLDCAAPLVAAEQGGMTRLACSAPDCAYVHWDNPTPVVAAVVEYRGKIVLARNKAWPGPFFALITGFLEKNEVPHEAVLREVEEELGLHGEVASFIGHYGFERMNQLIIAYHVRAEGEIVLGEELAEYRLENHADIVPWPAATGLALYDWLKAQGHEPPTPRWTVRPE
ncbi:NUDIX domain-containing protein [Algiphilus sp. W345]|uniref:NUDIX domain-containing protein n=1 Tax=Banduia mediterranea TaxID=3075609 RepID=A0ABU2WFD2_9GAMM|nr:NUDIX domain-containing protein [Algiphilus sp. W345]MDT0495792.1 NUDIX domain-containing protein [Algiphilus sp. W345]